MTKRAATATRELTGPQGHRLFGHLNDFRKDPLGLLLKARNEYGDVVRFWMGPQAAILLAHPEHIRHVLRDNSKNYLKRTRGYDGLRMFLGNGLVTSEGEAWLRNRRIAQPAFHRQRIANFATTMIDATVALVNRWQARSGDEPMDIAVEMMGLTMEIVGRTLLSVDVSSQASGVGKALPIMLHRLNDHITNIFSIPECIPTRENRRYHEAHATLDTLVNGIIAKRRRSNEDNGDLLSMLMHTRDEETGESMDDKQLRDEVMTIFLAGHETTANALTWTWYLLSLHPAVLRKLQAELAEVLGGRTPTARDFPQLPFTAAVFNESMRLYPPVVFMGRRVMADDVVDGYTIPAQAIVIVSPYVTHRHPAFWQNPEGYDPERFIGNPDGQQHRFAYFPFSAGPRQCIGNNFALLEGVLLLATIAQRFQLELVPGHPVSPEPMLTLRPRHGMMMHVRAR